MSEHVENGKFAAVTAACFVGRGNACADFSRRCRCARAVRVEFHGRAIRQERCAIRPRPRAPRLKPPTNPAAASAPSGGLNTGIQIHGHWKIVVRNPDGTVATRREFENSLTYRGAFLLQNFAGRHA